MPPSILHISQVSPFCVITFNAIVKWKASSSLVMESPDHPDSFHRSIRPLLLMAQICGLIPVKGIFGPRLKFSWGNNAHFYAFFISSITLFFDACYTIDNFSATIRLDAFASTVFYTVCLLTTLFFLQITKQLPEIAQDFLQVENNMTGYGYPKRLALKIKLFLCCFALLAIVEHGTMACINFDLAWRHSSSDGDGFGLSFYNIHFPAISRRIPYSGIWTMILFWVNVMCTVNWNYLDFFLIVMSMEVYSRFAQINTRIKNNKSQRKDPTFWEGIRRDYNELSVLTKKLDNRLAKVILSSFFSNLYHLSLQLVRSLKIKGTLFQMTYFYFSLSYLIIRLLLVLFCANKINTESKKPIAALSSLNNPCPEAVRILHQILTDDVAFTGNKFFVINKKFFVSVVGTIITYQGFLLQFNILKNKKGLP